MLQWTRRRRWLVVLVLVLVGAGGGTVLLRKSLLQRWGPSAPVAAHAPEAPPDLAKLRGAFKAGVAALQRDDGAEAVRYFSSFSFGPRAVEEYRLYYLANGYQLSGQTEAARTTLAQLWRRAPHLLYADDVAFNLGNLYAAAGDAHHAADVYASLARRTDVPAIAGSARWNTVMGRMETGDVPALLFAARSIVMRSPKAAEAAEAIAVVRSLTGIDAKAPLPLTPSERLERGEALLAAGDAESAYDELTALAPSAPQLEPSVQLQRGIALNALRKYEDSNKLLEPLTSGTYRYAIPALRFAARNYAVLSAAIDPNVTKVIKERKRVGTLKVRVGKGKKRHTVLKPRYQTVSRTVKLVDLAKKQKKDEYTRLASERLRDLLLLPIDDDIRLETLNTLIARAQERNQTDYLRALVPQVVKIDPDADPALQYLWDDAWNAWTRGDLAAASKGFRFIADAFAHPNVRRQSEYWYARTAERLGKKEESSSIYRKLAAAPYQDLYSIHSVSRGAPAHVVRSAPRSNAPDWRDIAAKKMPKELQLAYELTALASMRDAYLEVRKNARRENAHYAEALMSDYYSSRGERVLMYRSLRRAWPQLATVEQDDVPEYFFQMYYPREYAEPIDRYARKNDVDPDLVRAIILQESYYNPEARSGVGATGLMQLMPSTAEDHARRLHVPFAASRLDNPEVNIQLGTYHLKMLLNLFGGNPYLAVASYNAGQGNVMKWRRAAPRKPLDELLESIPFPETRNYVKRVTILRSTYARIGD